MPQLITPESGWHAAWLDGHREWGPGVHEDGFGLSPLDDVRSADGFAKWVRRLTELADPARAEAAGRPPCVYRWIVEDGRVLGGAAVRWGDSDYVRWAGHIGYGIRPSARRRGVGAWTLARMLTVAGDVGLERALAVCSIHNEASMRTIESCGGIFEEVGETPFGPSLRYWLRVGR